MKMTLSRIGVNALAIISLSNIGVHGYFQTNVPCIGADNKPAVCPGGSVCTSSSSMCYCPYEFQIFENGACVSLAGGACDTKYKCVDGADCDVNKNCVCRKQRFEDKPSGKCLGLPDEKCTDDSQCATAAGVTCDMATKKCKCTSMFGMDGPCFKDQMSKCDTDSDCSQHPFSKGLKCLKNICDCEYGQNYNKDFVPQGVPAIPKPPPSVAGKCEIPLERRCNTGEPDKCAIDRTCDSTTYRCQCRPNAEYNKDKKTCNCKKQTVDNKPYNSCDCYSGASLVFGTCQCQMGYEMHDPTLACQPICQENAEHNASGACVCKKGYTMNDMQKCIKDEKLALLSEPAKDENASFQSKPAEDEKAATPAKPTE